MQRVLIQYFDSRNWIPVEMFPANATRTEWSGGLPGVGAGGVFFVQAVENITAFLDGKPIRELNPDNTSKDGVKRS